MAKLYAEVTSDKKGRTVNKGGNNALYIKVTYKEKTFFVNFDIQSTLNINVGETYATGGGKNYLCQSIQLK